MATKSKNILKAWTPEETEILTTNWLEGKEAKDIEGLLTGRTVKSIWTKVKKLKLKRHKATVKRLVHVRSFKELERGIKKKVTPYVQPPFTGGKLLSDLSRLECHYPHAGQIYCGEPTNRAYGYCDKHHAVCYKAVKCS